MSDDKKKIIEQLNDEAMRLFDEGQLKEAMAAAENAHTRASADLEKHPLHADSLFNLGRLCIEAGDFERAENLLGDALNLRKELLGESHEDCARVLHLLGWCSFVGSDFAQTIETVSRAAEIVKSSLGERSELYADCLNVLAGAHSELGSLIKAERLTGRMVEIRRKNSDKDPQAYARSLNNRGTMFRYLSRFDKSLECFHESLEILKNTSGSDTPDYANCLSSLGALLTSMGNFTRAEEVLLQALEIFQNQLGKEHYLYAQALSLLGDVFLHACDYDKAEEYYRRALEIEVKVFGEDDYGIAESLGNLGIVLRKKHQFADAEQLLKQTTEITLVAVGEESPGYAIRLADLGYLHRQMGNLDLAESEARKSVEIFSGLTGDEDAYTDSEEAKQLLANIYASTGRVNDAFELMTEVASGYDRIIGQVLAIGSESQRMEYLKTIKDVFDMYLSLVIQNFTESKTAVQSTLNLVLRRKAIVAEAVADQRKAVLGGKYPELKEKLDDVSALRMQIALKAFAGPGPEGKETHYRLLREWNTEKEKLEGDLAKSIPQFGLEEKLREADRNAIADSLPEGSLLVEFVRFREFDFKAIPANGEAEWKHPRYIAFLIRSGEPDDISLVDLGDAGVIDRMITEFRSSIIGEPDIGESRSAQRSEVGKSSDEIKLREIIFDKLSAGFKGCKRLLLAPDGDLHRLPFEVLPTDDGGYLIDEYQISYLSVGRDVLRLNSANPYQSGESLVVADPDFDIGAKKKSDQPESAMSGWRHSKDMERSKLRFGRLPGTRPEGKAIAAMLSVEAKLEGDVLESKIKSVSSPFVMHIATHGFFLADQSRDTGDEGESYYENPLLRSGLALAGANNGLRGEELPAEAEDGILTAEDVSGLDLLGTELVVLSACDTGLGVIHAGEGVLGMRRAFILAGTQTLVMSLWKVPDLATPILMERFYSNMLERGLGRDEALRDAQIYTRDLTLGQIKDKWLSSEMIDQLSGGDDRARHKLAKLAKKADSLRPFENPCYWGAFICQGDFTPLTINQELNALS